MIGYCRAFNELYGPKPIEGNIKMNERIRELLNEATSGLEPDLSPQRTVTLNEMEKFAELIVQDCANFVREEYDHVDAEGIAWYMEIKYGLHGDYA